MSDIVIVYDVTDNKECPMKRTVGFHDTSTFSEEEVKKMEQARDNIVAVLESTRFNNRDTGYLNRAVNEIQKSLWFQCKGVPVAERGDVRPVEPEKYHQKWLG